MPNWISGTLKVRGTYEDVKKFYTEGVSRYNTEWDSKTNQCNSIAIPKEKWMKVEESGEPGSRECYISYLNGNDYGDWTYVEDTRRAFISSGGIWIYEHSSKDQSIGVCRINQAWGFEEGDWVDISKKYNVDVRLYGLECGMCFGTEIEIHKGKVIFIKDIVYDDWSWECPFPDMGG